VSDESIQRQLVWFTKSIHEYDHVFYIPPEIELEADGTRSEDEAYRIAIDATLKKLYNFAIETAKWNKIPCKIHKISGSVDERIS
ncbi:AAA family ATPase, partial [Escherichia coli]|uniref:AAA family ATPase n=1 Tax=Escherichia coli TaxID=562 RepID=UPI003749A9AD